MTLQETMRILHESVDLVTPKAVRPLLRQRIDRDLIRVS